MSGSARVSRAGDSESFRESRTFLQPDEAEGANRDLQEKFHYILRNPWDSGVAKQNQDCPRNWTQDDDARKESSFRRDAETSTRDACATQTFQS
jgi:type I restriction-modification system DNA methylase subunit